MKMGFCPIPHPSCAELGSRLPEVDVYNFELSELGTRFLGTGIARAPSSSLMRNGPCQNPITRCLGLGVHKAGGALNSAAGLGNSASICQPVPPEEAEP